MRAKIICRQTFFFGPQLGLIDVSDTGDESKQMACVFKAETIMSFIGKAMETLEKIGSGSCGKMQQVQQQTK